MPEQALEIFPGEVFANTADFDASIRQLIPYYEELLDAIARCLPVEAKRILELGCGTGELTLRVLQRCPSARVIAMDYSPRMLDFVEGKLAGAHKGERWHAVEMDFGEWAHNGSAEIGTGFDAVVSSLAIHHLSNEMKLKLFERIRSVLNPGGSFWNADPVLPDLPQLADTYQQARQSWAQQRGIDLDAVRAKLGRSEDYGYSSHDQLATLAEHLQMLEKAGFRSVAVPFKYYGYAVFGAVV